MMVTNTRTAEPLANLSSLRWVVGFLGSKKHFDWWDCSFLDETGIRFLTTTFPRSAMQAALQATVEAAQRVHDQALGRMGCYHLFRLPPSIEDRLTEAVVGTDAVLNEDAAMETLAQLADASIRAPLGPVQVGVEKRILTPTSVSEVAAHYHSAFVQGIRCYPYFSPEGR